MKKPKLEAPEWFFAWMTGRPYITTICGWSRHNVINEAEKAVGDPWKKIYRNGGRAVRCKVVPK